MMRPFTAGNHTAQSQAPSHYTTALIDAAICVKVPFYRNIPFVNFSQLERISLLNCWERGELSLTLDQVPRAPPDCGRY